MMRAADERQGIGVYTTALIDHLLRLDGAGDYVLFFRTEAAAARFAGRPRVATRVVPAPGRLAWDQLAVPLAAARERLDVLFHTKFTVPLLSRTPAVTVLHGAGWYTHPECFPPAQVAYARHVVPLYCRKASALVANSEETRRQFITRLGLPPERIRVVHLAPGDRFRPVADRAALDAARRRYRLPERFVLVVAKPHPLKNVGNLARAFARLRARLPCGLVVVGRGLESYPEAQPLRDPALSADVRFTGWVDQDDLPALYTLAVCLFFPSVYEAFGIPVVEAMACGCPVVASRAGALPEITGDAGLLVDPSDVGGMADALARLVEDDAFRRERAAAALERGRAFGWDRAARETLAVLEAARHPSRAPAIPLSRAAG